MTEPMEPMEPTQPMEMVAAHAGLLVVMNRCPAIDHPRLVGAT